MFTLKNKNERSPQLRKVDQYGEYAPFPGVTVVSACYPEQKEFCEAIYKVLQSNSFITHYYSPLPADSYHMTTMSLETEQQVGDIWDQFISTNLPHFKKIKQTLQKFPIYPSIERMEVFVGRCISLNVTLPKDHAAQIEETAEALNIEHTIPPIFHITLAYSRPNKSISHEESAQLQAEIIKELNVIIKQTLFPLKIAEAKLCYFNDMTAFIPWNAEQNPFIHRKHPLHHSSGLTQSTQENLNVEESLYETTTLSS